MQQQKDGKTLHRHGGGAGESASGRAAQPAGEQLELSREIREHFDNIQRVGTMDEQTMRARQPFAKQDREAKKKAAAGAEQAAAEAAMVASERFVNQSDDGVAFDSLPPKASAETALAFRIVLATIDGAAASGESGMPSRSDCVACSRARSRRATASSRRSTRRRRRTRSSTRRRFGACSSGWCARRRKPSRQRSRRRRARAGGCSSAWRRAAASTPSCT
jgi:hypothetical protein